MLDAAATQELRRLALPGSSASIAAFDQLARDAAKPSLIRLLHCAVITRLAAHPAALVFVASHVGEVTSAILGDPRIALRCFAADVTGDQPRFDYRLRDGVSEQRLGMTLLRQEGVLNRLEL